ncbi:DNA repair protein RecN [Sphingomicrobium lutaoense]|uniref:DNA repair protein RecN n=1 Tax=Sphingomicrobium lutaoense TaxID=515949 RepID=A0A839YWA6_9SPHN|nr:DNA repair protein RecN [Sphingomicrobium lutaoense]MBB3764491.1 DNA repair protein RecN (Recombination protein N) [Sphingomicrobium lutaoense]
MLRHLSIRDVVLVERLDLEFEAGLGVLTGETGAGKSILLDALGLALGARADSALVRSGADKAEARAELEVPAGHAAYAILEEQGVEIEPGEPILLARTVKGDGGSRARACGTSIAARSLRDLGSALVEIHGQHDDRGLLDPKGHQRLLDAFGQIDTAPVGEAWTALRAAQRAHAEAKAEVEAAEADRDFLDHAVAELEQLSPREGEEAELADLRQRMKDAARIEDDLEGLDPLLSGAEGALSQMRQAARRLQRVAEIHPSLAEALAATDRAIIEADSAEEKIIEARRELVHDPAELDAAEERLFAIRGLARKHRVEPDGLVALLEEMRAKRDAIATGAERLAALEKAIGEAQAAYDEAAAKVRSERGEAAARLDARVAAELKPLKLDAARFATRVAEGVPGPSGVDEVSFTISTNPGSPFGPLSKIASGGELSRFILALKVALAEVGSAGTIIFDEIDRGVGGAVASAIGERLHRLANDAQVLVVTHSPQVAARAAHHYRIEKVTEGGVTRTHVRKLSAEERREEIARMLSGSDITDEARAQAAKLMEAA